MPRLGTEPGPIITSDFVVKGIERMAMHRLTSITIGVPNVREPYNNSWISVSCRRKPTLSQAFAAKALMEANEYRFATVDGGEQLRIVHSPRRRVVQLGIGVENPDDLGSITSKLKRLDLAVQQDEKSLRT